MQYLRHWDTVGQNGNRGRAWVPGYLGGYCATEDQPLLIRATVLRTAHEYCE